MIRNNPLVSVIVPCYNVEKYIKECMNSITANSYQNLEIIAVDDGSTDNTGQILDLLKDSDSRIKVIHQKNGGLSAARNTGLKHSHGKYLSFVDSDDVVSKHFIEIMLERMQDCNVNMAQCEIYKFRDGENPFDFVENGVPVKQYTNTGEIIMNIIEHPVEGVMQMNKMFAREIFFDENNNLVLHFPEGYIHEDEYLILEELLKSAKMVILPPLYAYRTNRKGSITNTFSIKNLKGMIHARMHVLHILHKELENRTLYVAEFQKVENYEYEVMLNDFMYMYLKLSKTERKSNEAKSYLAGMKDYWKNDINHKKKLKHRLFFLWPALFRLLKRAEPQVFEVVEEDDKD